jgi:integrase
LNTWAEDFKRPNVKPSTYQSIMNCVNNHISDTLKDMPLTNIKPIDIQKCLNGIKSTKMRQYTYIELNDALSEAVLNGFINVNPCAKIKKPKHADEKGRALTDAEIKMLIENSEGALKVAILGYLYTGARRNELLDIKLADCDLQNNTITIIGTKSATSKRIIPMFAPLRPIIEEAARNNVQLPFYCSSINFKFKALCDRLGIENAVIHSLRHTFASHCNEKGIPMSVIQKWLGHAQLSTTQNIYTHATESMLGTAYDNLYDTLT